MKINRLVKKGILIFCSAAAIVSLSAASEHYERKIMNGVVYRQSSISDADSSYYDVKTVNSIDIGEFGNLTIKPTIAYDNVLGLETIGNQAKRETEEGSTVIAGINCDMFAMESLNDNITGIPMNMTIIDGVIYNSAQNFGEARVLPVFAVRQNGTPYIGNLTVMGKIEVTDKKGNISEYKTEQFNRNYGLIGIGTFTRRINGDATVRMADIEDDKNYGVNKSRLALYVISGVEDADNIRAGKLYTGMVEKITRRSLEVQIPEGCIAFADATGAMSKVREGDNVTFEYTVSRVEEKGKIGEAMNDIEQCVGAYNWIVKDGVAQTEEIYKKQGYPVMDYIVTDKTAKTGIGITQDGHVIAATVDRNASSDGVTMEEWGEYFASVGCVNAVNFDGGGSTEMILINQEGTLDTVNSPTDGASRDISTGLLFISDNGRFRGYDKLPPDKFQIVIGSVIAVMTAAFIIDAVVRAIRRKVKKSTAPEG